MKVAVVVTGGLHPSGTEEVIPLLLTLVERLSQWHEVHAFSVRHLPSTSVVSAVGRHRARPRAAGGSVGAVAGPRAASMRRHGPFDIDPRLLDRSGRAPRFDCRPPLRHSKHRHLRAAASSCHLPAIDYGSAAHRRKAEPPCRSRAAWRPACTSRPTTCSAGRACAGSRFGHGVRSASTSTPAIVDRPSRTALAFRCRSPASAAVKDQTTLLRAVARRQATRSTSRLDLVGEDTLGGRVQQRGGGSRAERRGHVSWVREQVRTFERFHEAAHLYVQSSLHEAAGVAGARSRGGRRARRRHACRVTSRDWAPHGGVRGCAERSRSRWPDAILWLLHADRRRTRAMAGRGAVRCARLEY